MLEECIKIYKTTEDKTTEVSVGFYLICFRSEQGSVSFLSKQHNALEK